MGSLILSDVSLFICTHTVKNVWSAPRAILLTVSQPSRLLKHRRRCVPGRYLSLIPLRCVSLTSNGSSRNGIFTVGDFMTRKEDLHVVKPTTTVDRALEMLVENRITGFPVIDDDWKLVGVVSDYDLLALDSISGSRETDTNMFPEVDSTWKTFNAIQKLLSKTNGKLISDVMSTVPIVVRETTNLEDAARLLLETKYRRLLVVDSLGKLVGIITRGNVVRAALEIKHENEKNTKV
ncbi:CBS domain-containing protein CBSX1, chloroplastic [Zostera marina]|uniref:CBS domain-containing protein CBSX1, chloroplastic n=1 Tax=Zostera marina TaxID=29655 RepID=A0A0K9NZY2_ZOSMR|nr:CBS domain-containing protein CBSX1, chloroplastic [Zostera marina]